MNVFKWMKDYLGNRFYPYTHIDAVIVDESKENPKKLTDELKQMNNKINGFTGNTQSDWNETDLTQISYIKNKPISLPANGGNADTLGGKRTTDFADRNDFENHLTSATAHQELFNAKLNIESANNLIKDLSNDPTTGIITITRMDNTTFTINISNFAHRFYLCTLKIQYLAVIQLSRFYTYAA